MVVETDPVADDPTGVRQVLEPMPVSPPRRKSTICSSVYRFFMDPIPSWQNRTPDHNAANSGDHVEVALQLKLGVRAASCQKWEAPQNLVRPALVCYGG